VRSSTAARRRSAAHLYRARNVVERSFNKIKQCRRVATRYDKLAANYLAFIQLASIRLWLRVNESTPSLLFLAPAYWLTKRKQVPFAIMEPRSALTNTARRRIVARNFRDSVDSP
jgi:hypothetical protein